jgi:Na+-transporting NADH:ubiquinone oxidoreductase subunit F
MEPNSRTDQRAYTVSINTGERLLNIPEGTRLLDSLAQQGVHLLSACQGKGECGYCKLIVTEGGGEVEPAEAALLTPDERKRGTRLACRVKVHADMRLKIPRQMLLAKRFIGVVEQKKPLTYDIVGLTIRLVEPQAIAFIAGQHIKLISEPYGDKPAVIRNYSIASAPSQADRIDLIIRRVPNGVCTTWVFDHLAEGRRVSLAGPYGSFHLRDTQSPIICIAGGSGLSSIWGILQELVEKENQRPVSLFFGALTKKDLYFIDELDMLQKKHPWFRYIPALSNEPPDSEWPGQRGLITEVVGRTMPDSSGYEAYLCGSPGMIDACIAVLKKTGTSTDGIFFDKFVEQ